MPVFSNLRNKAAAKSNFRSTVRKSNLRPRLVENSRIEALQETSSYFNFTLCFSNQDLGIRVI